MNNDTSSPATYGPSHLKADRGGEEGSFGSPFPVMFLLASADGFPQPLHCISGHLGLGVRVNNRCQ